MNDNLTIPKRPIDEVDASLKELLEDVKSLKSDVSYIKHNIKRFLKEREEKVIGDLQAQQEGWWIWKS